MTSKITIPPVTYDKQFLAADAARFFTAFGKLPWQRHIFKMYGKEIPSPRLYVWMGTSGTPLPKYFGPTATAMAWSPEAEEVRNRVRQATGVFFDSLNINMYRDNKDHLGWHIDPEEEGRWDYPIVSITLGAERLFQMRQYTTNPSSRKRTPIGEIHSQLLEHGSMLVMPPQFQAGWLHRVPKTSQICGMRINLTFRRLAA